MKIGHIVSTMNNLDIKELILTMKLKKSSIIINQSDKVSYENIRLNNANYEIYNFNERGVGLSRNSGLMRAIFDIIIVSDDDMIYIDGYEAIIEEAYKKYPDADMILFDVRIHENGKIKTLVRKEGRVRFLNCLKYGAVSFTFKNEEIRKKNIVFSLLFGGGAKYSNGEDTIFIWECLRAGLRIYSVDSIIADIHNDDSSWFEGYNEKYFKDRGVLFATLTKRFSKILCLQFALRKRELFRDEMSWLEAFKIMLKGTEEI